MLKVTVSTLNVRFGPGTRFPVMAKLHKGDVVSPPDSSGWLPVELPGGSVGWVSAQYIETIPATAPAVPSEEITEWPWLKIARQELGVKEMAGSSHNPRILEYLKSTTLGRPDNERDETPWCSAFVNWVLKKAGVEPRTNSAWARSWLNWGVATDDPIPGTIVVFSRGTNAGHVGFYLDEDATRIQVLGGNQGNAVTIAWFPKANLLGYREPKGWEAA